MMDGVLFLLWCWDILVYHKMRVMDSSRDLSRKGQVTPGDHLEGVGGEKSFCTHWLGRGGMSETESGLRSREMATESREQTHN